MAKINWTDKAKTDIDSIIEYYAPKSESYAKTIVQRIFDTVELIEKMPEMGRVVQELEFKDVREILIGQYRVIYFNISSERTDILKIHHSSIPLDINDI